MLLVVLWHPLDQLDQVIHFVRDFRMDPRHLEHQEDR